jgi:hypothetical protein
VSQTYDPTLPTALDRVRFLLGATDVSSADAALISNEELLSLISKHGETEATAQAAEGLASRWAQEPDRVGLDGDTYSWSSRVSAWQALAKRLRGTAAAATDALLSVGRVVTTVRPGEEARGGEYERPEDAWWPRPF